mgnify:CR=1 FL=1
MFNPNSQQSTLNQVDQKAEQYMGNPQELEQKYKQNQQLIDLLALQKIKSQKEAAAREMALKMAQQTGKPQTIEQQREQQEMTAKANRLTPKGCCYYCEERFPEGDKKLFCDRDCATDYEEEQRLKNRR